MRSRWSVQGGEHAVHPALTCGEPPVVDVLAVSTEALGGSTQLLEIDITPTPTPRWSPTPPIPGDSDHQNGSDTWQRTHRRMPTTDQRCDAANHSSRGNPPCTTRTLLTPARATSTDSEPSEHRRRAGYLSRWARLSHSRCADPSEEIERVLALGAVQIADRRNGDGSGWMVLADPEGNRFCIVRSDEECAVTSA